MLKAFSVLAGALAVMILATRPAAAQSTDLSQVYAYPPLHYAITPDATASGVLPGRMKVAYGFNKLNAQGKGQTIALVDAYDDPTAEKDLNIFSTRFQLPACTTANGCFKLVYAGGSPPPADTSGWSNEAAIDTQWAHAMAPAATIMLVEANSNNFKDLLAAVGAAVKNGATVVSMSWSGSEITKELSLDAFFNVKGVTFVASSGDYGHGPQYPAASPFVVAVGGTSLTIDNHTGKWVNEVAWPGSGGGLSHNESEPSYQAGAQTSGKRGIPDVAYDADPDTGVPSYNSHACGGSCYTGWGQWGGTSIGAPEWAALFAIANCERASQGKAPLNQVQFVLYAVAETAYHDITSGSNGGCGTNCTAAPGYDLVTGLGSPQANLLVPALVKAQ